MSATTDIKFEFYIESTSDEDTSTSLSPSETTDLGLNAGVVVDKIGGGITFDKAGSIKGGKTDWDVGIGFWLGYQPDAYKVAIGDPNEEKITWDGEDLVLDIDASHLTVNGGTAGQVLSVDSNGLVTFIDRVENLDDLGDVTGVAYSANSYPVLIPQSGNVYGFVDLRSITDTYIRLRDLTDVANVAASTNQVLVYNGTNWAPATTVPNSAISMGLEDLTNVSSATPATNQVLGWSGTEWQPQNASSTFSLALGDLTDVTISPSNGDVLWYNSSTSEWEEGKYTLGLTDITNSDNKSLRLYDPRPFSGNDQKVDFEGGTGISLSRSGTTLQINSSALSFKTISVAGQTDVVADTFDDTLTFVAGSNMTISTNASADSITFASTGGVNVLNDLTNVVTSPANGEVLWYNTANSRWEDGGYQLSAADASSGNNKEIRLLKPSGSYSTTTGTISLEPGTGINIGRSGQTLSIETTAATEAFKTISVSGQSNVQADTATDTLTFVAGSNMTITTNASTDTITFAASGGSSGASEAFKTIAVSGQSDVVADSAADTLTFVAGSRMGITTNASADSITLQPDDQTANLTYYKNVNVNGLTNVAANQKDDTITFMAGTGINLTADTSNTRVTIAASGSSGASELEDADGDTKVTVELTSDEDAIRFYNGVSGVSSHAAIIENDKMAIGNNSSPGPVADLDVMVAGNPHVRIYNTASSSSYADATLEFETQNHSSGKHRIVYQDNSSFAKGGITYDHTLNDLIFYVNNASAVPTDKIRFLNSGGITFDGETTEPHALDDYEEGTWTPHFADAVSGGNYVTAGTAATGSYTKIGNVVHLSCPAQNINPSGLNTSNVLYVRNFPFTLASTYLQVPCTSINFSSYAPASRMGAYFMGIPGSTYGNVQLQTSNTAGTLGVDQTLKVGEVFRTSTPYTAVRWSLTYIAA